MSDLRRVIDEAPNERPIQRFLQDHREIFAMALLRGHTRIVRSQVRLGAEYVADFLIADVSSIAAHWTLVELESPRSPMFIADGDFARKAREGLRQIGDWRDWLAENLRYARQPKPNGLGLAGITADAQGLVLIGRRSRNGQTDHDDGWLRRATLARLGISVHTYDWLLDLLDGQRHTA